MKKLLLIVMVAAHFVAFGQKKKKSIPPPPEKITKQKVQKSPYQRIFEDNMMLAFQWRMEVKDSIIIANEDRMIYKIYLEFQSDKEFSSYKKKPHISALKVIYSVEKGAKLNKNLTPRTHYVDLVDYPWISESVKIVGDNVELTNDETKEKQIFKIFLDEDKKNIIKLQDSKTKKEFFPTEDFYTPAVSI